MNGIYLVPTLKITAVLSTAILLSACAPDPQSFETEPVDVETELGTVTCQLYTERRVLWDRAIDRPKNMSVREADNICRAEGLRRKNAS